MENDDYVKNYIAQVNSELQTKILEVCSLKAQLQLANAKIAELQEQGDIEVDTSDTEQKKK